MIDSELFAANEVLPKHGFTDILPLRPMSVYFPFDILAKKEGKIYAVDVTMHYSKKLDPKKIEFLEYLNLNPIVCFVKPDHSWATVREFGPSTHIWVQKEYRKYLGIPDPRRKITFSS